MTGAEKEEAEAILAEQKAAEEEEEAVLAETNAAREKAEALEAEVHGAPLPLLSQTSGGEAIGHSGAGSGSSSDDESAASGQTSDSDADSDGGSGGEESESDARYCTKNSKPDNLGGDLAVIVLPRPLALGSAIWLTTMRNSSFVTSLKYRRLLMLPLSPFPFSTVNLFCTALLYGRAGRLTAQTARSTRASGTCAQRRRRLRTARMAQPSRRVVGPRPRHREAGRQGDTAWVEPE